MTRVLIVEDEESLGDTLRDLLTEKGFEVDLATNGIDALTQAAANPPDVILLDLMLPILDGVGFLGRLRGAGLAPNARVIVMSSAGHGALEGAYVEQFLAKPFRLHSLIELLGPGDAP